MKTKGMKTKRKSIIRSAHSPLVEVAKYSTGNERNTVSSHSPFPEVHVASIQSSSELVNKSCCG